MASNQFSIRYFLRSALLKTIDFIFSFSFQKYPPYRKKISHPKVQEFIEKHGYFSSCLPLVCVPTENEKHTQICLEFLQNLKGWNRDQESLSLGALEFLAKVLAYRKLQVQDRVEIAGYGTFIVETIFFLQKRVPAYGLYSKDLEKAILLFRGTELSLSKVGRMTLKADLDPFGPGCRLYLANRRILRPWMRLRKPRVIGHSLGGALASYATLFDADLLDSEFPSLIFNAPGLYRETLREWERAEKKAPLISYITEGDFICKIGKQVGRVQKIEKSPSLGPLGSHTTLTLIE